MVFGENGDGDEHCRKRYIVRIAAVFTELEGFLDRAVQAAFIMFFACRMVGFMH